jgi:hypothetical protein
MWFNIRKNRLTASEIGEIFNRKKSHLSWLSVGITRHVTIEAIRQGLSSVPAATNAYFAYKSNIIIYRY